MYVCTIYSSIKWGSKVVLLSFPIKAHMKGVYSLSDVVLGHLKWGPKDGNCHFSVEDADWATSDKPIVLGSDGCVRVYDSDLRSCRSVLNVLETCGEE